MILPLSLFLPILVHHSVQGSDLTTCSHPCTSFPICWSSDSQPSYKITAKETINISDDQEIILLLRNLLQSWLSYPLSLNLEAWMSMHWFQMSVANRLLYNLIASHSRNLNIRKHFRTVQNIWGQISFDYMCHITWKYQLVKNLCILTY